MKRLLLVIAGIALLTVACRAEVNVRVDINEDQTGTATFEVGLDDEFKGLIESNGGSTDDLFSELNLEEGAGTAFTRTEGDMTYTGVEKDFTDIAEVTDELSSATGIDGLFDDFTFEMDDKTAELTASITAPEQDAGDFPIDPSQLTGDLFSSNFILTMPGTVVESNADEVLADGSLRWDLPILGGTKDVHARSEFGGSSLWWLWIVLGVVLVVGVIAIVAAVLMGKRQQQDAVNDAAAQYPESAVEALASDTTTDDTGSTVEPDDGDASESVDQPDTEGDPDGSEEPEHDED